jgi:hypothetical protein
LSSRSRGRRPGDHQSYRHQEHEGDSKTNHHDTPPASRPLHVRARHMLAQGATDPVALPAADQARLRTEVENSTENRARAGRRARRRSVGRRESGLLEARARIMAGVTAARDELHHLVDQLPEDQVSAALIEVQRLADATSSTTWPPAWFGAITAGRTDTSERVDELLAEGFGR